MWHIAYYKKSINVGDTGKIAGTNSGFSLVEVLVAIGVASVLLAGLSTILFSSLRLFGSSNANVEVQNESQRVLNLVLDNIMEAESLCMRIPASGVDTECILLGDLILENDSGNLDEYRACYRGAVIAYLPAPVNEMYLIELQDAGWGNQVGIDANGNGSIDAGEKYCVIASGQDSEAAAAQAGLQAVIGFVSGSAAVSNVLTPTTRIPWLMGSYVSGCVIAPPNGLEDLTVETVRYLNGESEEHAYFTDPFVLRVDINFAYPYNNRTVDRHMVDDVSIRSRLKKIYVEDSGRGMMEYQLR